MRLNFLDFYINITLDSFQFIQIKLDLVYVYKYKNIFNQNHDSTHNFHLHYGFNNIRTIQLLLDLAAFLLF